jgi:hypothetical protein
VTSARVKQMLWLEFFPAPPLAFCELHAEVVSDFSEYAVPDGPVHCGLAEPDFDLQIRRK